jgi:flagellar hook assembly protein FlgD
MADIGPIVGIADDIITHPLQYKLSQNFPNPFNPETRIYFEIPENQHVQIIIYDLRGYRVRTITNQPYTPGQYVLNWDGKNQAGRQVASGVYILRMKAGDYIDHKKMMLIR